ncbi:MAG: NADH:flavin oxidoreductase, partial [Deltaproteobacteria bacterium]|nr:NADH:flavin oxidoreductase [Deltaproteobacteria bacterium]
MTKLFETTEIRGMKLANRFVRSATWEGMATEDGACTPGLVALMRELARGRVGLIITSHAYVRKDGQAGPWQLGIYEDGLAAGLKEMTRAVHDEGGCIVLQLSHAGFFANPKLTGTTPLGASEVEGFSRSPRMVMTSRDIGHLVKAFGRAAG